MIERFTQSSLAPLAVPTRAAVLAKREERLFATLIPQLQSPIPERFRVLAEKLAHSSGQDAVAVAALLLQQLCADRSQGRHHVPDDLQPSMRPERSRFANDRYPNDRYATDSRAERGPRPERDFRPERGPRP